MTCMREDQVPSHRFVEQMKRLRQERRWSQERLVEEVRVRTGLHLNATVVTKLEWALSEARRERARTLSLDEAVAIATALGVTLLSMITDPDSEGEALDRWQEASLERAFVRRLLDEAATRRLAVERELLALDEQIHELEVRAEDAARAQHPSQAKSWAQTGERDNA
jgi:transcriptional regulator with XRE-family HTH domain